ncbi:MAG: UDP-3-O-(3-hydroxymyristoyl)glucosamine N-acyltransferase [Pseudomonadota bacterium]
MAGPSFTVGEIAKALGLEAWGDTALRVGNAAAPHEAGPNDIALAADPKYAAALGRGQARAALLWADAVPADYGLAAAVLAPRPRFALSGLSQMMDPGPQIAPGVHPKAHVEPGAEIGDGAAIGPFAVIGAGARIGPGARIAAHAVVGAGAVLGRDALLLEHVVFGARCRAGDRFIAQPGAVIGGDGFSYVTPEPSAVEAVRKTLGDRQGQRQQAQARIHSLAAVTIGDDVEVGSNACIDRGTLSDTVVGDGTKIDNLVQVAHNVRVGKDCLLCGQAGIAGSSTLGDRVVLGGQAGVIDHLTLGDDVILSACTPARTDLAPGTVMIGPISMEMKAGIAAYKNLRRLPRLLRDVAALRKHLPNPENGD